MFDFVVSGVLSLISRVLQASSVSQAPRVGRNDGEADGDSGIPGDS